MSKVNEILAGYRPPFIYADFQEYINKLGFTIAEVAKLTEKSERTVRNWIQFDAPRCTYYYLYCCAGYVLHKNFHGFQVKNGELFTHTRITRNKGFSVGELTEYAFFHDYMHNLKNRNEELELMLKHQETHGLSKTEHKLRSIK